MEGTTPVDLCREEIADGVVFCLPDCLLTGKCLELARSFLAEDKINNIIIELERTYESSYNGDIFMSAMTDERHSNNNKKTSNSPLSSSLNTSSR